MATDVVDCEIKGAERRFVAIDLDPGESAVAEAGSLRHRDAGIVQRVGKIKAARFGGDGSGTIGGLLDGDRDA